MNNEEIYSKIKELRYQLYAIPINTFEYNPRIKELNDEIKKIQAICPHEQTIEEFSICAYCGKRLDK